MGPVTCAFRQWVALVPPNDLAGDEAEAVDAADPVPFGQQHQRLVPGGSLDPAPAVQVAGLVMAGADAGRDACWSARCPGVLVPEVDEAVAGGLKHPHH